MVGRSFQLDVWVVNLALLELILLWYYGLAACGTGYCHSTLALLLTIPSLLCSKMNDSNIKCHNRFI